MILIALAGAAGSLLPLMAQDFTAAQLKHPRVHRAAQEKEPVLRQTFQHKGLPYPPNRIFIRVFKREKELELWASASDTEPYTLAKVYSVCESSGELGPKRREGDGQVPEGFYVLENFNPQSQYHLSLRVSYPNASDRILGPRGRLGGDIYIHGNCVTIGCVPITDDGIKEVYWLAVQARSAGQAKIPIHIFPARLTAAEVGRLEREYSKSPALLVFWNNLRPGYDYFEKQHRVPRIEVDKKGNYILRD